MSVEKFKMHRNALIAEKLKRPKKIALQKYHFDRSSKEVKILKNINKTDMLDFFKVF